MRLFKNLFRSFLALVFFLVLLWSCSNQNSSTNTYSYELIRFEQIFFESHPDSLAAVEKQFPYFFPKNYPFSVWVNRRTDSLQMALYKETKMLSSGDIKDQIDPFIKGLPRVFENVTPPKKVITITSDVDYNNKVILNDTMALVSIDNFLGVDHFMYQGIAMYLRQEMNLRDLSVQLAESFAERILSTPNDRSFLSQLIHYGKIQYIKQMIIPDFSEDRIMGYTPEQLEWARTNEKEIWNFFVSKELLFSTDQDLISRFIFPAPFSKFYLNIDVDSPGKIGQWLGLQIVNAYQRNERKPIDELIKTPTRVLFENSKYKPRRK